MSDIAEAQDILDTLAHPQPDPDLLPACIPPHLMEQQQTAEHLLRASLRLDDEIETTKAKMSADMAAWQAVLAKGQEKREAWRAMVLAWMQRNNVTQLKTPWLTASITKGRTEIVVDDETKAIAALHMIHGGEKALKVKESIVKTEFDAIFNAIPKEFESVAHIETGEPSLLVRRKE